MKKAQNEYGRTMLETIMYIGVLIALSIAIANSMKKLNERYKVGRLSQQLNEVRRIISDYTSTHEDYTKIDVSRMNEEKIFPRDLQGPLDDELRHAMNGAIKIGCTYNASGPCNTSDCKYMFYITFERLSQSTCIELVNQKQFFTSGTYIDSIIINNDTTPEMWHYEHSLYPKPVKKHPVVPTDANKSVDLIIPLSDAITACSRPNDNSITWIFS